jgi:hypothetical protein
MLTETAKIERFPFREGFNGCATVWRGLIFAWYHDTAGTPAFHLEDKAA